MLSGSGGPFRTIASNNSINYECRNMPVHKAASLTSLIATVEISALCYINL